jgi:hypothetical protein
LRHSDGRSSYTLASQLGFMLAEAGLEPAPERSRKRTWKQFLRSHWDTLYACQGAFPRATGGGCCVFRDGKPIRAQ